MTGDEEDEYVLTAAHCGVPVRHSPHDWSAHDGNWMLRCDGEPTREEPEPCEDCAAVTEALWRLGAGYAPDWAVLSGSGKSGPPPTAPALRQAIVDGARARLTVCPVCHPDAADALWDGAER